MQILEAALAFAITMLVLAMVVSAFVELIHRVFSMREAGLQYMLGQLFDQVLSKYLKPEDALNLVDSSKLPAGVKADSKKLLKIASENFVQRMSTNRAPMGVPPDATPADGAAQVTQNPWWRFGLWSGRDLTTLTPAEFMERLGAMDIGEEVRKANDTFNKEAADIGIAAANAVDVVLKDVAQKFEAFGKEASAYFEGRARLISVGVAVALAFAVHVDAIELFNTYLRDPAVRANVIGKLDAVVAEYKNTSEVLGKAQNPPALAPQAPPTPPAGAGSPPPAPAPAPGGTGATPPPGATPAGGATGQPADAGPKPEDLQKQWAETQKQAREAIDKTKKTVSDLSDLGVPIGWNDARREAAQLRPILWNCPQTKGRVHLWGNCPTQEEVWIQVPTAPGVILYLFIGGLLIGLGGPFWYNAITSLTNIRNAAGKAQGTAATPAAAASAPAASVEAQPIEPVDIFKVAQHARVAGQLMQPASPAPPQPPDPPA